jgi:hypothetical protein
MKRWMFGSVIVVAAILGACGGGGSEEEDAAGAAQSAKTSDLEACKIFLVKEQKLVDLRTFAEDAAHPERKNDPVLQKLLKPVLEGKTCPKTYAEMQTADGFKKDCPLESRIVSERVALTNRPEEGRVLSGRSCNEQPTMFFLLDPVDMTKSEIPSHVEVLGNDAVDGIFSYYAREEQDGRDVWKFFGTSVDIVSNGYDCDPQTFAGACQSKLAQDDVVGKKSGVRCASCHPGGGMVQKELHFPWTNWMANPADFVGKHADLLGSFQNGQNFEHVTTRLNNAWAKKRVEVLAKKGVKELLRPLFCTMDINLQEGMFEARADLMIDLAFANPSQFFADADVFGGIGKTVIAKMSPQNYLTATRALHQRIDATFDDNQSFVDTPHRFIYPERGALDHQYIFALREKDLVSEDLIRDILFVDFTRPIFSPTRCGLVELAEGLTDPATAKADLIAAIERKGANANDAEREFLRSLKDPGAAPRHQARVQGYLDQCKTRATRDNAGFTNDLVRYASHLRQAAKRVKVKIKNEEFDLGILDFDETVPRDDLWDQPFTNPRFNPDTCVLE